jgi:hypothetical protein
MRTLSVLASILIVGALSWGQTAPDSSAGQAPPATGQAPGMSQPQGDQPPQYGRRGGQRGPGVFGAITAIDGVKITIKTQDGQTAQVSTTDQTQFRKDRQPAKLADFKVGDEIFVRGEQQNGVWQAQMIGARPAGGPGGPGGGDFRAEMGKRFIAGEVKAINGTSLTILRPDGETQNITVDESTSFQKDRQSITLADIKVGDQVYGRGELKNDVFVPAQLNVGQPPMGRPRDGGPSPN